MNLELAKEFVREELLEEQSGHDYVHIERVLTNALMLAKDMPTADVEIVSLAALLHDVIDEKVVDDVNAAISKVRAKLRDWQIESAEIAEILDIITHMSYSKNLTTRYQLTLNGQIVQDADRLDAIGAIGIGRTFYYGGHKGHLMYNPNDAAREHLDHDQYRQNSSVINHFYEKLLKLTDLMNTPKAKTIAEHRTEFMQAFLNEFDDEWHGRA
ncbi:HD domain-containing protein [Weissella diestrammenae]|uniref:HD domain-containing protein n=1 Tax=Weissella diestrammenae TaxID=1162633 RepID=A0A7G9T458_9LACO|nr:HD domain-containing protein [Weissella diestrammenae]MCM0583407.1 HD domain-containing protein [Weissella diestrammenae]QNN74883.1 HD domain-containing protein [Weissella diestrammenae]